MWEKESNVPKENNPEGFWKGELLHYKFIMLSKTF